MSADLCFCPPLADMVSSGRTVARNGKPVIVGGLSTVNNLLVLRNLFAALNPATTLETGLGYGASALVFAQSHRDFGAAPCGQHVAIDPFQDQVAHAGVAVVKRAGLNDYLDHINDFSDRALPRLLAEGRRFGLIYIDGSHLFEDVMIDCHYATQLLLPDGVLLFDDSSDPHVAKVLGFIDGNMGHVLTRLDVARFRGDAGRSFRYRLGKLFGRTQLTAYRKSGEGRRRWDSKLARF